MYIKKFFAALWADWVALMSGVASIVLAFWAAYLPPTDIPAGRVLLWIAAVICFVLASYRIWSKEHKARLKTEQLLLTERQKNVPDLLAELEMIAVGTASLRGNALNTTFTLVLSVRNLGTPSIAEDWMLTVSVPGRPLFHARPTAVHNELSLERDNLPPFVFSGEDMLYKKTENPIDKGDKVAGVLMFIVQGISRDEAYKPETVITLSYADVTQRKYELKEHLAGDRPAPMYFSGLKTQPTQPLDAPRQRKRGTAPRKPKRKK